MEEKVSRGRVSRFFGYIAPTVFYLVTMGDTATLKFGVGLELGVADFQGNVVLSDGSIEEISYSTNEVVGVISYSAEYRWRRIFFSFTDTGPEFSSEQHEYFVSDASLKFGIIFPL